MQGKLSGHVMMATLSVVGTRAMQVYTSAQFARARVSHWAPLSLALNLSLSFSHSCLHAACQC